MIHTLSSREFGHNVSSAKSLAKQGPVLITDRGEPAFVLMNIEQYRAITGAQPAQSLLDLMDSLPDSSEAGDFELTPIGLELRSE
ncbi:type II toxin-antitoxin system prevent-host-death family antitoxin [Vandammella animalimorsus]|uniref:type II toxin-antitoxin system prevent-host-death family antitoxin n=1 Tax=Vandammella animalimorsus TaxID=2029117 RepID=UPI000F603D9C|nr:type II toxin-antitoxin system Phd/YefM family antitoxin [Comamonadaceae bacterium OH2310_COT-174]